jgi:GNAT superfamily N-acetyltransferase
MTQTFTIRSATAADYTAFARLFPELGVDDPIPTKKRWDDEIMPSTWIAERAGLVLGYCFVHLLTEVGRVRHLVVAREAWRSGIGRALMQAAAKQFRTRGVSQWCLNVKPDNIAAIRLYESLGLRPAYRSCAMLLPWNVLHSLPPDEAGVMAQPASGNEDQGLELAFKLPSGLLADTRGKPGRVLVKLAQAFSGTPLGIAGFDTTSRHTYPFRVTRTPLAGTLLRALGSYVPPQGAIQLVLEDDMELVHFLLGAGATMRLDVLHFRGNL